MRLQLELEMKQRWNEVAEGWEVNLAELLRGSQRKRFGVVIINDDELASAGETEESTMLVRCWGRTEGSNGWQKGKLNTGPSSKRLRWLVWKDGSRRWVVSRIKKQHRVHTHLRPQACRGPISTDVPLAVVANPIATRFLLTYDLWTATLQHDRGVADRVDCGMSVIPNAAQGGGGVDVVPAAADETWKHTQTFRAWLRFGCGEMVQIDNTHSN